MKNNITKFYKEMFIKSLIEDTENWKEIKHSGWYDYKSPLYGNIQFEIDGLYDSFQYNTAIVYINDKIYLDFNIFFPFSNLAKAVKKLRKYFNKQRIKNKNNLLQKSLEEYLIN